MASQENEIREQQRASWNKFSSGWRKWDKMTMEFLQPVADAMLGGISWKDDFNVLDVASGTGEPGLTAAGRVKRGKVVATDLAEEMINVAAENARARRLPHFETRACSADALPFGAGSFDVVLCRFGYMFFPDIPAASKEMARVLAPGGTLCASVWSVPEKNPWATTIMGVISKHVEMPAPAPDSPGLFRCANPQKLVEQLSRSGLRDVSAKELTWEPTFGSPDTYWSFMTEVAAPVVAGLAKADETTREKIRRSVLDAVAQSVRDAALRLPAAAWVVTASK